MRHRQVTDQDPDADPFGELGRYRYRAMHPLLGAQVHFQTDSAVLMALVAKAYAGLPAHRFSRRPVSLNLTLSALTALAPQSRSRSAPPPMALLQAGGLLAGVTPQSTLVSIAPDARAALVCVPKSQLRHSYHIRYELIEFAVFALAARAQGLIPLHAACVGLQDRGVLLMGASGAGKSTLALSSLLGGFQFLSEDSTFVDAAQMRATGVANFLHVRADSLRWLKPADAAALRRAPVIQRRSGIRKFELDLRRPEYKLAAKPMKIVGTVFLTPQSARKGLLLKPVGLRKAARHLTEAQSYGTRQPSWASFERQILRRPVLEMRRGEHPFEAAAQLRQWLLSQHRSRHG